MMFDCIGCESERAQDLSEEQGVILPPPTDGCVDDLQMRDAGVPPWTHLCMKSVQWDRLELQ